MSAKYEFIDGEKAEFSVSKMCSWLKVSRSGYYDWRTRPASATAERRAQLTERIRQVFADAFETYGYRRIHAQLAREGIECSPELVRKLMRAAGLVPCQPGPRRWGLTAADDRAHRIRDLVGRDFCAEVPGTKLVGDITYVPTGEGWLYLATVIDCATKKIVGWATADHFRTELIEAALRAAADQVALVSGAIFHSDRGSNYTSGAFGQVVAELGMRQSVGRTGICYDNAMAESFFAAIKNEWLHRQAWPDRAAARRAIVRYIEGFYNRRRLHSGLGYRTPQEAENRYWELQLAA